MKIGVLLLFVALAVGSAFAGERTLVDVLHTGWAVADGAPSGVHDFAQTTDGYLWLASTTGLFRFDGVRFERYEPRQGGSLQFRDISALLATPDGGLWIGRAGRAIFLRNDRIVTYGRSEGLPLSTVFASSRIPTGRSGRRPVEDSRASRSRVGPCSAPVGIFPRRPPPMPLSIAAARSG